MKIKVAICTADTQYEKRVTQYFQTHYYDKFIWNVFTDINYLMEFLKSSDVDIVLLGMELREQNDLLNLQGKKDFVCAYLTDDAEENADIFQLEKYKRGDLLYRELLELYSDISRGYFKNTPSVNKTEIYAFVSPAGGVGTSTIATAAALDCSKFEKILYLDLETVGTASLIFIEEGKKGFDELIFAMKSRRSALELKLASTVSRDKSGVFFFESPKNAMDILELTAADIKELIVSIQNLGEYDKVIIDAGNGLGEKETAAMLCAARIIMVIDDKESTEKKAERYMRAMQSLEKKEQVDICSRMLLFYNKVIDHTQLPEQKFQMRVGGSFPKLENGTYEGIIHRIAGMEMIRNVK